MPQSQAMRHFVCRPSAASLAAGSAIVNEHRLVITVQLTTSTTLAKSIPKNCNVFMMVSAIMVRSAEFVHARL